MKNLWLIPALAFYILLITLPLPPEFRIRGAIYLTDTTLTVISTVVIFFAFRQKHWFWKSISLALTMWLFTIPMLRIWESAVSNWNIVLGILPWSDASGYYADANRLLWGGDFGAFSGRRPIFAGFLAVLLKLTSQNLQITLLILTGLNGLVAFLTATYVRDHWGPFAGTFIVLMVYVFYKEYIGTTLTEQLGLPLGLLAVILQIKAISQNSKWQYAFGLSILTFALLTRAGPFFVLPFLFLFGLRQYITKQQEITGTLVLLTTALLIPFAANLLLQKGITSPTAASMGNFSYTLYGQAVGGKGWGQVMQDYPELQKLPEKERTDQVYSLAFQEIRSNPLNLMQGSLNSWRDFFIPNGISFFSRQYTPYSILNRLINIILTLVFAAGIYRLWKKRNEALYSLFLFYIAGIFISVPFLPPIDANVRPYITIIVIFFIIDAFTIVYLIEKILKWKLQVEDKWLPRDYGLLWQISMVIFLVAIIGPFLVKTSAQSLPTTVQSCQPGEIPVIFELKPGSFVTLKRNEDLPKTKFPEIPHKDVVRSMENFYYGEFATIIRNIKTPATLTYTINLAKGNSAWIIAPPETSNTSSKPIFACGLQAQIVYRVIHITSIHQQSTP